MDMDRNSPHSALDDLYWQDEILQVMYWLLGEGFADRVTVADLRRFLAAESELLAQNLERLSGDIGKALSEFQPLMDEARKELQKLVPSLAERLGKLELVAYQASPRGGTLRVRLDGDRVKLGGRAVTVLRCELAV